MRVTVTKTKGIILKGKLAGRPPAIRLNNEPIQFLGQVPYLGILLDHNLTFLPQVKKMGEKAKALFGKIARNIKLKYGSKPRS